MSRCCQRLPGKQWPQLGSPLSKASTPLLSLWELSCAPAWEPFPEASWVSPVLSPPPERSTSSTEGWPPCAPFPTLQPRASALWEGRFREGRCSIPSVRPATLYEACYDYSVAIAAHCLRPRSPRRWLLLKHLCQHIAHQPVGYTPPKGLVIGSPMAQPWGQDWVSPNLVTPQSPGTTYRSFQFYTRRGCTSTGQETSSAMEGPYGGLWRGAPEEDLFPKKFSDLRIRCPDSSVKFQPLNSMFSGPGWGWGWGAQLAVPDKGS